MMNSDEIDELLFGMKTCSACGDEFIANSEWFGRDRSEKDGLTKHCRGCRMAFNALDYERRRETILAKTAVYRKAHPRKRAARQRAYRVRRKARQAVLPTVAVDDAKVNNPGDTPEP
jgi:hypothetical protein